MESSGFHDFSVEKNLSPSIAFLLERQMIFSRHREFCLSFFLCHTIMETLALFFYLSDDSNFDNKISNIINKF